MFKEAASTIVVLTLTMFIVLFLVLGVVLRAYGGWLILGAFAYLGYRVYEKHRKPNPPIQPPSYLGRPAIQTRSWEDRRM